jgi:XisI protein
MVSTVLEKKGKIAEYEHILIDVLQEEADCWNNSWAEEIVLVDTKHKHYQLLHTGWDSPEKKVHDCFLKIHFKIDMQGKVCLLANETETLITEILVERGIPKSDIILAFIPPQYQQYSEYGH